jgi:hypothetical protein
MSDSTVFFEQDAMTLNSEIKDKTDSASHFLFRIFFSFFMMTTHYQDMEENEVLVL